MSRAITGQDKADPRPELGLYVHVPFCSSTCDFCAFYQVLPTRGSVEGFLEGIEAEAALVDWPAPVATVFWGGGTPGLLAPRELERLSSAVRARAGAGLSEWTVELAPGSVTRDRLRVLREAGVTRLSLGVQSFQAKWLDALGRQHTAPQALRAYEWIRECGFTNVNLDLMFAMPGQTEREWISDLDQAAGLGPEHLSTYCLTLEEDTALWIRLSRGRVKRDVEAEARLYEAARERLGSAGYEQYEVSNFARPGRACLHNLNTWRMQEWVGLGPAAASQHGGWRGANVADLKLWRERVARGERMTEDRAGLTPALIAEDALIFGLRMNAGVDLRALRRRCPGAPWALWDRCLARLEDEGLLARTGGGVRLTDRGRLLADAVGSEIMAAGRPEAANPAA